MKYTKLFERGKIGKMELKNRIVLPPMGTGLSSSFGEANDQIIKYYEERAKGGCGLIITEITRIDDMYGVGMPTQLRATEAKFIPGLERLLGQFTNMIQRSFYSFTIQERKLFKADRGKTIVAPSAVMCKVCNEMPRALTTQSCDELVKKFIVGANIAKAAGVDGVELHAAHGI
jgi:2,4-dienoyl-CoA reductase-like NADH-dependent reductase (Old Yellow Enzyme family)